MVTTATTQSELALLALLLVNSARALLPICTGPLNATVEGSGVLCVADELFCSVSAVLHGDANLCGDGDFWENCGAISFNFGIGRINET